MLKNASFLAIVAVHTAENEPPKVLKNAQKFLFKKVQVTPEVSTTMKCVINLTIQYFVVYTALAVVRTYNELNNAAPLTTAPKILEAACTTVNYAPMLSVFF